MGIPRVATYRLQLRPELGFEDARALVPYLQDLGVSHLYASPYLQAAAGSTHGYDVVDHSQVNVELGGEPGRRALCKALAAHGMAQLLDIVPNHMAIRGGHNAWWWDVLENGASSRFSSFFDVEWHSAEHERVVLPILGDQYGVELEARALYLERVGASFFVRYYEHKNPVAPRSLGLLLASAAALAGSDELGFLADAFAELPSPNAPDRASRARRHRDKKILERSLTRLLESDPSLADRIDEVIKGINAEPDELHEVLERQNYRLAYWRVGNQELDYRRFFDIDSLVGLRVEDEEVFDATHDLVLRWLGEGAVDGVRIDHIDGLYDPVGYLERLRERAPGAWIVAEKILEGEEHLPSAPVQGTTGYDFLNHAQRWLVAPDGEETLSFLHSALNGSARDAEALMRECKGFALDSALGSDMKRLIARLAQIFSERRRYRDFSRVELADALRAFCVALPVYRTYRREGQPPSAADREVVARASRDAREQEPGLDTRLFDFLQELVLETAEEGPALDFVLRWQQTTGPAMAKGLEDTAFYRHCRLVALNEVGGDLARFSETTEELHTWLEARHAREACPLNATSTHDTKRSEDVRARLLVLSERPERWRELVLRWLDKLSGATSPYPGTPGGIAPEPATQYILLQNLIGAWPISEERLQQYMVKAIREAKLFTSWDRQDEAYEQAVAAYVQSIYRDVDLQQELEEFVAEIRDGGYANSLCQLLLKMLAPGVPDIYQGTELWDFSLVDPDNRRPVDYAQRRRLLQSLEGCAPQDLWTERDDGRVKLYVLRQAAHVRRRHPAAFDPMGSYTSIRVQGGRADRVFAFLRGETVIGVVSRWFAQHELDFDAAVLPLPSGLWTNALAAGSSFRGEVLVSDIMGPLPVAVLERVE